MPEPCKENAYCYFITKTILNRLKSLATERIDLMLILDPETREKPDVGSEFTNCKQNDSVFLESNQMPLDVTVPKISTAGTILNQEVTNYTLANYRENRRPAIHISQASLKEYADLIANTILMLIKNDIDLEIQKMYTYQNNTSFQENIIASETVNNTLKSLCNKIPLKASDFFSKQDPDLPAHLARVAATGAFSVGSYPMSEVRGKQPRVPGCDVAGMAERSCPTSEVRGSGREELPHARGQGWRPGGATPTSKERWL